MTTVPDISDTLKQLLLAAATARQAAYCPYSGYAVGAAVLAMTGAVHAACNVENASFGLSICAERSAVFAAVAAGLQPGELQAIAVVGGPVDAAASRPHAHRDPERCPPAARAGSPAWPALPTPCGACLQVLAEFAAPDCLVLCAAAADDAPPLQRLLRELLPHAFRAGTLPA